MLHHLLNNIILKFIISISIAIIISITISQWILAGADSTSIIWWSFGISILFIAIILHQLLKSALRNIILFRIAGGLMLIAGAVYVVNSIHAIIVNPSILSVMHLFGFLGILAILTMNYVNQFAPKNNTISPALPEVLPHVAVVIPTYGEPLSVLDQTITAATQLDYPTNLLHIILSDDGHRDEVQQLAESHGIMYILGPRRDAKAGNLNAALAYIEDHCPEVTLILTQDADELVYPDFLLKIIGYFNDNDVAFVQTRKDAIVPDGDIFGTLDRIFYDVFQTGRNGANAAIACGSGVIWKISALAFIGGFSTWNIVEDLTTSYTLHSAGYHSEYHNENLSIGLAPTDIPGLLKQRGTWAIDTWRLFLFDNPARKDGLTWRQRLQYLELPIFYGVSSFLIPLLMLVPIISLLTGQFLAISAANWLTWTACCYFYCLTLSKGDIGALFSSWRLAYSHAPTHFNAFWRALVSAHHKPRYTVTRKTRVHGFYGHLLWPQYLYFTAACAVILYTLFGMPEVAWSTRMVNLGQLTFSMYMVFGLLRASFYGIHLSFNTPSAHVTDTDQQVVALSKRWALNK